MTEKTRLIATVLAASEVVPAEWRDLSEVLQHSGGPIGLLQGDITGTGRESEFLRYLRRSIDASRVIYWERQLNRLFEERPSVSFVSVTDPAYPINLLSCYDKPPFLFVDGCIGSADDRSLAIVGSRKASGEALSIATAAARMAAEADITVISGLAKGVDGAAHRGALDGNGRTIAVIGSGIDRAIYPPEHQELARRIRHSGALMSQFRPDSPMTRSTFVARNSVISGLARASLLIQADESGGTKTEAEFALKQDRMVYIWGPIAGKEPWVQRLEKESRIAVISELDDVMRAIPLIDASSPVDRGAEI
jgi:DNA processing protein